MESMHVYFTSMIKSINENSTKFFYIKKKIEGDIFSSLRIWKSVYIRLIENLICPLKFPGDVLKQ